MFEIDYYCSVDKFNDLFIMSEDPSPERSFQITTRSSRRNCKSVEFIDWEAYMLFWERGMERFEEQSQWFLIKKICEGRLLLRCDVI